MVIRKILIYGSTPLTEKVVNLISDYYNIVGYVPSKTPFLEGNLDLPVVNNDIEHDIKLSIQYDQKINDITNAFNVHTGLLPMWGGTNILYHTIKEEALEQGLTLHKIGDDYDFGEIISKMTYPVFPQDDIISLYNRMLSISPLFVLNSLRLLESLDHTQIENCNKIKPRMFTRDQVDNEDKQLFQESGQRLKSLWNKTNKIENT